MQRRSQTGCTIVRQISGTAEVRLAWHLDSRNPKPYMGAPT